MDQLIFQQEGWPLVQESIKQIERAYTEPLTGLGKILGDNVILSGLNAISDGQGNTSVSPGYVVIGGEILPFEAGIEQTRVIVVEEITEANYDVNGDNVFNSQAPVWKKRYAKFGSGAGSIAFSEFTRLDKLNDKVKFLKKGYAKLTSFSELPAQNPPPPTSVVGDFTAIQEMPEDPLQPSAKRFKIYFTEVDRDYFPVLVPRSATSDLRHFYMLEEKGSNFITMRFISGLFAGQSVNLNSAYDIYLIG